MNGTCAAASGSCTGGQCLNGSCCTGCISGSTCFVGAAANCGANGGACVNCDDGRPCTQDTCTSGSCQHAPITGGCNDGDQCTVNDACSGSTCAGAEKDCDDQNGCTMDDCNPQDGCTHAAMAGTCNDGNACTTPDSCSNGSCSGTALNCDDGNPCTTDSCNPMSGCQHAERAEGAMCAPDTAVRHRLRLHEPRREPGHAARVSPVVGFELRGRQPLHVRYSELHDESAVLPARPRDGRLRHRRSLRVGQTCQGGTCGGGTTINCNDDNPCTADACDPETGCTHTPGNDGDTCNDGNPCTTEDACSDGDCVGEPVECVAIDDCHDVGTCDADTGTCDDPRKPNGTECGRTGTCQSGRCEGDGVVEPTGGTGPGTAGGGPGGSDTGGTSGSAGETRAVAAAAAIRRARAAEAKPTTRRSSSAIRAAARAASRRPQERAITARSPLRPRSPSRSGAAGAPPEPTGRRSSSGDARHGAFARWVGVRSFGVEMDGDVRARFGSELEGEHREGMTQASTRAGAGGEHERSLPSEPLEQQRGHGAPRDGRRRIGALVARDDGVAKLDLRRKQPPGERAEPRRERFGRLAVVLGDHATHGVRTLGESGAGHSAPSSTATSRPGRFETLRMPAN